ncbi:Tetratricopeptide repeat (TPR)-like superfamily protein [Abeliophyllum distichum]|uniref:Tetratricopeptide repeat (TPR)-like superfamily protein n=1 Tax=Abeliophyllum distichum TaxID=126358 RepID=A0ABD1VQS3_9LAMI
MTLQLPQALQRVILFIQSCKAFKQLQQIQTQIITNGLDHQNHLATSHFLSKCSELKQVIYTCKVFDQIPNRRITSLWNAMSKGYLQNDLNNEVVLLFRKMMRENVKPNCYTLPVVLKACGKFLALREWEEVHCVAVKSGFISNTYTGTTLIELYSGKGRVECAFRVFTEMVLRNVVAWTAMIQAYVANGDMVLARRLFNLAPERDVVMWNRMVSAYIEYGDMMEAKRLFDVMPGKDLMSWNTLLHGYANNGDLEGCERLFEQMQERNVFSWNGLIGAYSQNERYIEVLDAFKRMLRDTDVQPNDATLVNVLTACARLGALDLGKWVHVYAESTGYKQNLYVCNGLIDLYAKCGVVESAVHLFRSMDNKDLISWNTIINGLAVHGHGADALSLFNEMKNTGEKLDGITFIGILCACSHMGLVDDGLNYFHSMINEYSIEPRIEHYGCVVDLLARAGLLEQAVEFIKKMPIAADCVIWTTLLAASRIHKKIKFAELSLQKLIELDPKNPANYVMLSNIYGEARKWEDLARLKVAIRNTGSKKQPGCSSIATDDGIVEFYSFDERHSKTQEIYSALKGLMKLLRLSGCVPDLMELNTL